MGYDHRLRRSVIETLEQRRLLAAVSWDGGGDGVDWDDPANWSNNAVPTAADDVTIDTTDSIVLDTSEAIRSLDLVSGDLTILAFNNVITLAVSADSANAGTITMTNVGLNFRPVLQVDGDATFTNTGTIDVEVGDGGLSDTGRARDLQLLSGSSFVNEGTLNLAASTSGTMPLRVFGDGTFEQRGQLNLAAGTLFDVDDVDLVQDGTITQASGSRVDVLMAGIDYVGGSHDGDFFARFADLDLLAADGPALIRVEGNSTASRIADPDFTVSVEGNDNTGVGTGSLEFTQPMTIAGDVVLTSTGTNRFAQLIFPVGTITFAPTSQIDVLDGQGGPRRFVTTSGSKTVDIQGKLNIGRDATLLFNPDVNVDATLVHGGTMTIGDNAELDIPRGTFIHDGTTTQTGSGLIELQNASLVYDGGSNDGLIVAGNAVTVDLNSADAPSTIDARRATTLLGIDDPDFTLRSSSIDGVATLNVSSSGPNFGNIVIADDGSNQSSTVQLTEGVFVNEPGSSFRFELTAQPFVSLNASGTGTDFINRGTFDLTNIPDLPPTFDLEIIGSANIINEGLVQKTGPGAARIRNSFDNEADVLIQDGILRFDDSDFNGDPDEGPLDFDPFGGGRYVVEGSGEWALSPQTNDIITIRSDVTIRGASAKGPAITGISGILRLEGAQQFVTSNLGVLGQLIIGSEASVTVTGFGAGLGNFDGSPDSPFQRVEAGIFIDAASATEYGRIEANGIFQFTNRSGGDEGRQNPTRINLNFVDGFNPDIGDQFDIIEADDIVGRLDAFISSVDPDADVPVIDLVDTDGGFGLPRSRVSINLVADADRPDPLEVVSRSFDPFDDEAIRITFNQDVSDFFQGTFRLNDGPATTDIDFVTRNKTTGELFFTGGNQTSFWEYDAATFTATRKFFTEPSKFFDTGEYEVVVLPQRINNPAGEPLVDPVVLEFTWLRGDANLDGKVDLADFGVLRANFGAQSTGTFQTGDFNGDRNVNLADFGILRANFGLTFNARSSSGATSLFADNER